VSETALASTQNKERQAGAVARWLDTIDRVLAGEVSTAGIEVREGHEPDMHHLVTPDNAAALRGAIEREFAAQYPELFAPPAAQPEL
jgi:hypothetical protein